MKLYYNKENKTVQLNDEKGQFLKINEQRTKGPNNEVVYIGDLEEANGQKWLSLSKLNDGINEINGLKGHNHIGGGGLSYTKEEKEEIERLENRIKEIKEIARERAKLNKKLSLEELSKLDISKLDNDKRNEYIDLLQKLLENK